MGDSEEENADDTKMIEEETTTEEFHDAATVIAGSGMNLNGDVKNEIYISVEITYRGNAEAKTSPSKHLQLINALGGAFDKTELDMYNIKGKKVVREAAQQWQGIKDYDKHFKMQQGNNRHYVIFRVLTTKKFGDLKRAPEVWKVLNSTGSYMKRHQWNIDQWDIITLGFLIEIDPSRHLSEEVREYVVGLSKRAGCFTEKGCNFRLIPERFKFNNKREPFTTYAYAIQCPRDAAKAVDELMKNTFRDDGQTYVKLKMKKSHPSSYSNAMTLQNRYLSHVRTITIVGITRTTMKILKHTLLMNKEINFVAATNKTDATGRWDVITLEYCQEKLQSWLEEKLDQLLQDCPSESFHDRPEHFPEPGIQSRKARAEEEESSQGDVSYLSSSAGSYDSVVQDYDDQANYQEEPGNGIIKGKTWAQAVARNPQAASTSSSHPTQSNISELTTPTAAQQNKRYDAMEKRLTDEIVEMRKDMQRMFERMELRDKKADETVAAATKAAAQQQTARPQDPNGNQYQPEFTYPPLGVNGYHTNYHPHAASPGYNYQNMYQGYPSGYHRPPFESPMHGNGTGYGQIIPNSNSQQGEGQQYGAHNTATDKRRPEVRDLNKRTLDNSPSFVSATMDRTKRKDRRETPIKNDPMEELDPPPDPAGKSRMKNPYNRQPSTPTAVSPPNHIVRGLYPLEWNKGRREERQHLPPPHYHDHNIQDSQHYGTQEQQQYDNEMEAANSRPAEDARNYRV
jgi:hypothetical protein